MLMQLLHVGTHAHATAPCTFDNCTRSGSPHNVLHSSSISKYELPKGTYLTHTCTHTRSNNAHANIHMHIHAGSHGQLLKVVLKSKPTDIETGNMISDMAQGCRLTLAKIYQMYRMDTGFRCVGMASFFLMPASCVLGKCMTLWDEREWVQCSAMQKEYLHAQSVSQSKCTPANQPVQCRMTEVT